MSSPEPAAATPPALSAFEERVSAFAQAVAKPADSIVVALKALVGDPGPEALAALSDPSAVTDQDLQEALVKTGPQVPLGIFRKNIGKLRGPQVTTEPSTEKSPSFDLLPSVPEDDSFLAMLKVGGNLKVGKTEVMSAIKAALAAKLGVYDLPDTILVKMEEFADAQEEPVGESFFALRKLVTTRSYGEILSVLGVEGSFCTDRRKTAFLERLDAHLWAEVYSFNVQVAAWQQSWTAGMANPGMMLGMLAMSHGGGIMPPGMMQPPETAGLCDGAEGVVNKINKVFAGVGIPIARALAYDATRIKGVLEDPTLPTAVGAANREQMLKMLGVTVGADYVRLERNITRFVLAIMEYPKVPSGKEEYGYLGAMLQLGASIPWDKLTSVSGSTPAGIGRPQPDKRRL